MLAIGPEDFTNAYFFHPVQRTGNRCIDITNDRDQQDQQHGNRKEIDLRRAPEAMVGDFLRRMKVHIADRLQLEGVFCFPRRRQKTLHLFFEIRCYVGPLLQLDIMHSPIEFFVS